MPMDPSIAASLVNAGSQTANSAAGFVMGLINRGYNESQYSKVRKDNLKDWEMQNAYNSPAAQMQRLKEAGLNPHLVYGTGAVANNAQQPKSAEMQTVALEAPRFDASAVMGAYFDTQMKQAQTDNLKVQKTVMTQEALLKSVQALNVLASTDKTKEETENIKLLRQSTIDAAKANVKKLEADIESTKANTFYTLQENMRKQELQPITIQTMNESIRNMIEQRKLSAQQRDEILARINNLVKDGTLKDWEIQLSRQGIKPSDPVWIRKLYNIIDNLDGKKGTIFGEPYEWKKKPEPKSWTEWLDRLSPY